MIYLILIGFAMLVIATAVAIGYGANFFLVFAFVCLATVMVVAVDGVTAAVCRALPKAWVSERHAVFKVSAKEKNFYEKIGVRKWKDKIPELGHMTGFRKNKLGDTNSLEYLERFLLENRYGEVGHVASCLTSFLILLAYPLTPLWLAISIPVAVVSMLMNIPSLFILRYTSYKLEFLRKSLLKKQQKTVEKQIA